MSRAADAARSRFVAPLLACCAGKRFAFPQLRTLAGSNSSACPQESALGRYGLRALSFNGWDGGIRTRKGAERCSGARPPQADAVSALGDAPKCRHYRNVPKCRLGTIFEDPPKDCGQKTSNMSTDTLLVAVILTTFKVI